MGVDHGRVYVINPLKPNEIREYEKTLKVEGQVERSACGTSITVGPTASFLASLAVSQLVRAFAIEHGNKEDALEQEIIFCLRPTHVETRCFK